MFNVDEKEQLRLEVRHFRNWADATFPGERYGEWETDYEDWDGLYLAARAATANGQWDEETRELLIYTIARDNEVELVADLLSESQLLSLADASISSGEPDAKWQLAVRLGKLTLAAEPERILLAFVVDANEYVRRRALMALAELGSPHAEPLAMDAWESGEQYQRMACLDALHSVASPQLSRYLDLAERDGRPYLVAMADKMKRNAC
jgi:HEAT repeat protein